MKKSKLDKSIDEYLKTMNTPQTGTFDEMWTHDVVSWLNLLLQRGGAFRDRKRSDALKDLKDADECLAVLKKRLRTIRKDVLARK